MYWNSPWFIILLLTGVIFVIAGWIMYRYPPKKINMVYGYRTRSSMANQKNWDFAQKFSSVEMMRLGAALMSISTLGWIIEMPPIVASILPMGFMILGVILMIRRTEKAIRQQDN